MKPEMAQITREQHEAAARRVLGEAARWCPARRVWHSKNSECKELQHDPLPPAGNK